MDAVENIIKDFEKCWYDIKRGTLSWNLFRAVPYEYLNEMERDYERYGTEIMGHYQRYNENWTALMACHSTRRLLNFTRFLKRHRKTVQIIIDDFIEDVNSLDTDQSSSGSAAYFPTILGIRDGVGVYWEWDKYVVNGTCDMEEYDEIREYYTNPVGISSEEGIELFDNLIELGADPNIKNKVDGKYLKRIGQEKFDEHVKTVRN